MMKENWKPTRYDKYEVSNFGRIRSSHRKKRYILNQRVSKNGYKHVWITDNGKEYNRTVHRLVALAFIPNPQGKPEVNHIDCDKTNNCVENLEWATRRENELHARRNGKTLPGGEQHWNSILNWTLVHEIRDMYASGIKISQISKVTGIHRRTISDVVNFETWVNENIL